MSNVRFEEGTLPSGDKAEMVVIDLGPGRVGTFPADAVTPEGRETYKEKYAAEYERYKNGEQPEPVHQDNGEKFRAAPDNHDPADINHSSEPAKPAV